VLECKTSTCVRETNFGSVFNTNACIAHSSKLQVLHNVYNTGNGANILFIFLHSMVKSACRYDRPFRRYIYIVILSRAVLISLVTQSNLGNLASTKNKLNPSMYDVVMVNRTPSSSTTKKGVSCAK
jgi:hypothetical protein